MLNYKNPVPDVQETTKMLNNMNWIKSDKFRGYCEIAKIYQKLGKAHRIKEWEEAS